MIEQRVSDQDAPLRAADAPAARVDGLRVTLGTTREPGREIVHGVDLDLRAGEILCLVGESGSGKTTVSMAMLAFARAGARIVGGSVHLLSEDVLTLGAARRRAVRGATVAYVAQDPTASFNPAMPVGRQVVEGALAHGRGRAAVEERMREVLAEVDLPATPEFLARYPHQLSGGQLQRIGIAAATMLKPEVLVLDEPTTGLDVSTQARVLTLVRRMCTAHGIAALYVTHDLAVVADIADRVAVMRHGELVECGEARQVFTAPAHPYTAELLAAVPDAAVPAPDRGPDLSDGRTPPVLAARSLSAAYRGRPVLHDVSFEVFPGECLAIVGESGSGKSTLSKALIGLHHERGGEVELDGEVLPARVRARSPEARRGVQYVFQSPFNALNPRRTVGSSIALAHRVVVGGGSAARRAAVLAALERVGLRAEVADMLPGRLSGGERQRACIARGLVARPKVLVCDEVTSALDVVVQASVLDLLRTLQREDGLALVFVTHNLAVVRTLADRVLVLDRGYVVECGDVDQVLDEPRGEYTRQLLTHTLSVSTIAHERWTGRTGAVDGHDMGSVP